MLEPFTTTAGMISLLTLLAMEVVLGIDNIVFISILTGRLPEEQRAVARRVGLSLALIMRLGLLFAISWLMSLITPLFSAFGREVTGRDLILIVGGLFLVAKATHEIFERLEVEHPDETTGRAAVSFGWTIAQIIALDAVFSLDSVITAVGMAPHVAIMVVAMVGAVGIMLVFAGPVAAFIERHPSMKILALSFLLLIGFVLIAEGTGRHIGKGYIYFAMAFSFGVELINLRARKAQRPVALHHRFEDAGAASTAPAPAPPARSPTK